MWTIFKVFFEFVTILLLFYGVFFFVFLFFVFFWLQGMWDISFPTGDRTCIPSHPTTWEGKLTTGPLGKSLNDLLLDQILLAIYILKAHRMYQATYYNVLGSTLAWLLGGLNLSLSCAASGKSTSSLNFISAPWVRGS